MVANDPIQAAFLHGLLKAAGVPAELRNMDLWTVATGIFYEEGLRPSIWVRVADMARAQRILDDRSQQDARSWRCRHCDVMLEGQFTACWQCGRNRETDR